MSSKMLVRDADLVAARREICEGSFYQFVQAAWHVVEPSVDFIPNWHLRAICEHLEAVARGQIRRLIINIPPRHAKTIFSSVCYTPWIWTTNPGMKIITVAGDGELSMRDAGACRRLVESNWYRSLWPDVALLDDANKMMRFVNTKGGQRFSTSAKGGIIGEGADIVIGDDLHKVQDIGSDTEREKILNLWKSVVPTRLNNPKDGRMVLIMQRLHQSDVAGSCLADGGWEHLCLPAEYEADRKCVTSIGFSDPRKVDGELLWPAKMGVRELEERKRAMTTDYWGQYQQRPVPKGGALFKRDWFRYWEDGGECYILQHPDGREVRVMKKDCFTFGVLDPADSDDDRSAEACYSVCQIWARTPHQDLLLIDQYRRKVNIPTLGEDVTRFVSLRQPAFVCVEKNGVGRHAIKDLRVRGITIKPIEASRSKEERSEAAQARMQAGQIFHPKGASFLFDYEQELEFFPKSEFFDQVDCLSHAAGFVQLQATEYDGNGDSGETGPPREDVDVNLGSPVSPVWSVDTSRSWEAHVVW
jgi:predicted phage terminase large subunit-like protein